MYFHRTKPSLSMQTSTRKEVILESYNPSTRKQEKRILMKKWRITSLPEDKVKGFRFKQLTKKVTNPEYFSLLARFWIETLRLWRFLKTYYYCSTHSQTSLFTRNLENTSLLEPSLLHCAWKTVQWWERSTTELPHPLASSPPGEM